MIVTHATANKQANGTMVIQQIMTMKANKGNASTAGSTAEASVSDRGSSKDAVPRIRFCLTNPNSNRTKRTTSSNISSSIHNNCWRNDARGSGASTSHFAGLDGDGDGDGDDNFKPMERSLSLMSDTSRCSSIVSTSSSSVETPCPASPTSVSRRPRHASSSSSSAAAASPPLCSSPTRRSVISSSSVSALTTWSSAASSTSMRSSSSRIRSRYLQRLGFGELMMMSSRGGNKNDDGSCENDTSGTTTAAAANVTTTDRHHNGIGAGRRRNRNIRCGVSSHREAGGQLQQDRRPKYRVRFSNGNNNNNNNNNSAGKPKVALTIHTIPSLDEYTFEEKQSMWHYGPNEYDSMVRRNIIEYQSEGWDWTNCLEEDQMVLVRVDDGDSSSMMLVHPIHVWIHQQRHQQGSMSMSSLNGIDEDASSSSPPASPISRHKNRAQRQLIHVLRAQQQHHYQQQQERLHSRSSRHESLGWV